MSIAAVGAMSPHLAFAPTSAASKPESAEVAGAPDHDGDSDDAGASTGRLSSGSVSLYA